MCIVGWRVVEAERDGEAFIKKYWYPPRCDFEGPLVFPLYRLHGLPVVLHRYPVFRINITQAPVLYIPRPATIKSSPPTRLRTTHYSHAIYIILYLVMKFASNDFVECVPIIGTRPMISPHVI